MQGYSGTNLVCRNLAGVILSAGTGGFLSWKACREANSGAFPGTRKAGKVPLSGGNVRGNVRGAVRGKRGFQHNLLVVHVFEQAGALFRDFNLCDQFAGLVGGLGVGVAIDDALEQAKGPLGAGLD